MRIPKAKYIILIGAVCGAFTLQTGLAGIISVTGTNGSGEPLAATANFTFGAGSLSLTLSNDILNTDWISAGQALSDFTFTLSNGTTSGGSLNNITGTTIVIDTTNGSTSPGTPVSATDWQLQVQAVDTFHLTSLIGGQPDFMIAPAGNSFPNVNTGVGNFNPYLLTGPVTFSITGDFSAATTISSASFSFGTGPETVIPGNVPDSGPTAMLLGIALAAAGAVRRLALI
jgi:hypothetical protein